MGIQMIVNDLDRTLLRTDESISEYSLKILSRCREAGIKVIYATGRGERSARSVAPYEYFDGTITQGGAVVTIGNNIVAKHVIPSETARELLMAFDGYGIKAMSDDNKQYYTTPDVIDFVVSKGWTGRVNCRIVDFSTHDIDTEKINIFVSANEEIDFVKQALPNDLYLTVARDGHGIIMQKEATKKAGIMKLAEIWGIERTDIVSFGDDAIDLEITAYAGVGVAVANAIDEMKAIADHICGSNDDDGVAKWLEANVL